MKNCQQCLNDFEVRPADLDFYDRTSPLLSGKKYLIPAPSLCPRCREQRRMSLNNEVNLYHRKCDLTGKQIISLYPNDSPYTVYNEPNWLEDKGWDPLDYGREFDFSRPFFDQFKELINEVPHLSVLSRITRQMKIVNSQTIVVL